MDDRPVWLTLDEAANVLKVGVPTVQSLINRGLLPARIDAGQPLVAYADLLAFLRLEHHKLLDAGGMPADLGLSTDNLDAPGSAGAA